MYDFTGKTVLVTGGTQGIGLAISRAFAAQGAQLVIVGRNRDHLDAAAMQLGAGCETLAVDLALPDAAAQVQAHLRHKNIVPKVLINNAGVARFAPLAETTPELFDQHLNANLRTPFLLAQALLPGLVQQRGSIINISSYFARRMLAERPSAAYSASKGALESMTRALAFELGPQGIRVNAIAPGTVQTAMVRSNLEHLPDEARVRFAAMIPQLYPMGRLGEPDDLCGAALFLASDAASWITGVVLPVDGGLTTH
jgi:NAD(P)-dependent dehydrogenase (short-subunit alcohol dehydrogenase family)